MRVADVVDVLERLAPPELAAEWDNVGLLIGSGDSPCRRVMLCIDLTPDVLAEARRSRCQLVVAYHPPIFKPLSRLTPAEAPVVLEAIRHGLAVYSPHTALDAAAGGTNDVLAEILGLGQCRPLEHTNASAQCKIVVFTPPGELSRVADAAFSAGAGIIGQYYDCAFFSHGIGAFCGGEGSKPTIGHAGRHEATEEVRLEMICPRADVARAVAAVRAAHSYEEPAIDVYPLADSFDARGMGRIGRLARPAGVDELVRRVKRALKLKHVLLASPPVRPARVSTAACSAGSAGSMFRAAAAQGAAFYLTGEMRHHDALAATQLGLTVLCTGHSNSERVALGRLAERIVGRLPRLKLQLSQRDRDPFDIV